MDNYEYEKYVCEIKQIEKYLYKYGVAIISNILDEQECEKLIDGKWNYIEYITQNSGYPILRNDSDTWINLFRLYPVNNMLIQHWKAGHAQFVWNLRQNQHIVNIFSKIYNVKPDELLVSFDGFSLHLPPEKTGYGFSDGYVGLHCDQSFTRNELDTIQSWVNLYDTYQGDATLVFLEGSNKFHKEFGDIFNITNKNDWYVLNNSEIDFYKSNGCKEKRVMCPKGSLVMWDSRTIHAGIGACIDRKKPNIRCTVYLCYQPRNLCSDKNLERKKKAFEEMRMTSHNPCKIHLFSEYPNTYGASLPIIANISKPILSELGKKLAGF
jgi:hypothetical protein